MSTSEFIDGAVGKIAVHDFGGAGPDTLLICHATGFCGMVYRALASELADDVRVVALDMRAHGDSDAPTNEADFDWRGSADDAARVVSHLGVERLHGFGHSMGGAALLEVERTNPGTFQSAMVFEPIVPPGMFGPGDSPIQIAARGRLRTFPSRGHALERYAARPPLGIFRADVLHDYVHHGFDEADDGQITLKCLPEDEASTFGMAGSITLESLTEIELGVVVAKSDDGGMPALLADAIADQLPHGRLLEVEGITHFGPLQDPVKIAKALRTNLKLP